MVELEQIQDVEKLRNILQGKDRSISRTRAISMLAMSNFPNKEEELGRIIETANESDIAKRVAAISLGSIDTPIAKELLVKFSKIEKEDLLAEVILAMSRYGDHVSLKSILEVKNRAAGFLKERAVFAAALISHRIGIEGNDLSPPEEKGFLDVPEKSRQFNIKKADINELKICFKSIGERPFGIELSEVPAYQFNHGKNSIVLLNRIFSSWGSVKLLLERKAILGIIAEKNPENGAYFVSYLILTSPAKENNEINFFFARSYGKISFGGKAQVEDQRITFIIRSISEVGVFPMLVQGTISANSFVLKEARYSSRVPITTHPTKEV